MIHEAGFTALVLVLLERMIHLDSDCLIGDRISNATAKIPGSECSTDAKNCTVQYCQCYHATMSKAHSIIESARNYSISFANTENLQDFEQAVQSVKEVLSIPEEIFSNIENCTNTSDFRFSLYEKGKHRLKNYTDTYELLQTYLDAARTGQKIGWHYLPPILIVVFLCGMIGNGILLLIFFKHPETRSGPKVLLINLAISDILLLLFNSLAKYYFRIRPFTFGQTACRIYVFLVLVLTRTSILSLMVLSITRYIAVTAMPGDISHKLLNHMSIIVALVWVVAALEALQPIPDTVITEYKFTDTTHCHIGITIPTAIVMNTLTCFLPFAIIGFFTWGTYRRLQESTQKRAGKTELDHAKERNVKILPVLTLLFFATYPPLFIFRLVTTIHKFTVTRTLIWSFHLAQFLITLNSALNPAVLYLSSGMFKEYFKKYLCCGRERKQQQQQIENGSGRTTPTPC